MPSCRTELANSPQVGQLKVKSAPSSALGHHPRVIWHSAGRLQSSAQPEHTAVPSPCHPARHSPASAQLESSTTCMQCLHTTLIRLSVTSGGCGTGNSTERSPCLAGKNSPADVCRTPQPSPHLQPLPLQGIPTTPHGYTHLVL